MTQAMDEAIRVGCATVSRACTWPTCRCDAIPKAIQAAVTFAVGNCAKALVHEFKAEFPGRFDAELKRKG